MRNRAPAFACVAAAVAKARAVCLRAGLLMLNHSVTRFFYLTPCCPLLTFATPKADGFLCLTGPVAGGGGSSGSAVSMSSQVSVLCYGVCLGSRKRLDPGCIRLDYDTYVRFEGSRSTRRRRTSGRCAWISGRPALPRLSSALFKLEKHTHGVLQHGDACMLSWNPTNLGGDCCCCPAERLATPCMR